MGQAVWPDDWTGIVKVARTILELAEKHVFPGEPELVREFPDLRVKTASFQAHFRLQSDRLDWRTEEERTMVVVRFSAGCQPLCQDPWTLRIRATWPNRGDRLPDESPFSSKSLRDDRRWQKKSRERTTPKREPGPWGTHENLWIIEPIGEQQRTTQAVDLEAQVALFLVQVGLVPWDGAVREALIVYLRRTFQWRGVDDPESAVFTVYEHLRQHKWWPDDWRAWRRYVRETINGEIKKNRHRASTEPDLAPDEQGCLTIDQFAIRNNMSRSKAYELVRRGTVAVMRRRDSRRMVPLAETLRFKPIPRRADVIELAKKQRGNYANARKWVYRQERSGRTLHEIARQLLLAQQHWPS